MHLRHVGLSKERSSGGKRKNEKEKKKEKYDITLTSVVTT